MATFPCPHCRGAVAVHDSLAGRRVVCPHCQRVLLAATRPAPTVPAVPAVGPGRPAREHRSNYENWEAHALFAIGGGVCLLLSFGACVFAGESGGVVADPHNGPGWLVASLMFFALDLLYSIGGLLWRILDRLAEREE